MTKIILCGYRSWALEIFDELKKLESIEIHDIITSQKEYKDKENSFNDVDVILFIGWSWIIPPTITEKFLCIGIHPSDLPEYRGGSPLQHQILEGKTKSKVTLMTLSSKKLDAGNIWLKEDLDLSGNSMDKIFKNLVESSVLLLKNFFTMYPGIEPKEQNLDLGTYYKRRKPNESRILKEDFSQKSLKEIYNFIRCLTDPYPNAYLEDENGNRLIFKAVEFINSKDNAISKKES